MAEETEIETSTATESAPAPVEEKRPGELPVEEGTQEAPAKEEDTQEAAPPPYQPNFKYKVKDQELEFDEFVRGAIKDKEAEEKLRQLYTAASGVDEMRAARDADRQTLTQVQSTIGKIAKAVEKGDIESALSHVGIPVEAVFQMVAEKIKYENLPKEQKEMYDREREARRARESLEERTSLVDERLQRAEAHARGLELDVALKSDGIREIADSYDARIGKAGAFREKVALYGASVFAASGKDVSAMDAASTVANELKMLLSNPSLGNGGAASPSADNTVIIEKQKSPTIPAIGKAGSPGRPKVGSVADIRKIYNEKFNQPIGG